MQYLEGDRAMLTCAGEYSETIQISSVLYSYSRCSHGDRYGIQYFCDGQRACSFDVTNGNVGSSCGSDVKASLQVTVNVSYISYKHYFNLSCNCVILSTNKGVKYTLLFIHGHRKAFLVPEDKQRSTKHYHLTSHKI